MDFGSGLGYVCQINSTLQYLNECMYFRKIVNFSFRDEK